LKRIFKLILNIIPRPILIKCSYLVSPLITFYLKGKTYTDPIDGKRFRKLLPYGYKTQRANALSPSTFSLERHRLLWLYLKNETNFFSAQKNVLHIAPEQCFFKLFKKQSNLDYITLDINSPIADVKADVCNLPFDDEVFDIVFCNHVLEHIEDDKKAMSELYRVLKKEGMGIFQVPQDLTLKKTYEDYSIISPKERTKHFGQYDHVRIYGKDYFDRLREVGFKVKEIDYSKTLSKEQVRKYCLVEEEVLPVCTK
jgi:predicted SAM-dependent methyltransferase